MKIEEYNPFTWVEEIKAKKKWEEEFSRNKWWNGCCGLKIWTLDPGYLTYICIYTGGSGFLVKPENRPNIFGLQNLKLLCRILESKLAGCGQVRAGRAGGSGLADLWTPLLGYKLVSIHTWWCHFLFFIFFVKKKKKNQNNCFNFINFTTIIANDKHQLLHANTAHHHE